jgi:hypothetical protein
MNISQSLKVISQRKGHPVQKIYVKLFKRVPLINPNLVLVCYNGRTGKRRLKFYILVAAAVAVTGVE